LFAAVRRHALRSVAAVAVALAGAQARAAETATDAVTPAAVCGGGSATGLPGEALDRAARSVETLLARRGGDAQRGDEALGALAVSGAARASATPTEIAAYCSAAGESMRLAHAGSQFQAQLYLITAIRNAEQAGATDLSAIAAYRLALATVGGPVIANTRGGGATAAQRRALTSAPPRSARLGSAASGPEICRDLYQPALLTESSRAVTEAALSCANLRARAAGDSELAAITGLRLARFLGPASRERAAASALAALGDAMAVRDPALSVELTGRLAEAAIDTGAAADPALDRAVAHMRSAAAGGVDGEAHASAVAGRLALRRGDAEGARGLLRRAIYLENQRAQPLRLAQWFLWLAEAEPPRRAELTSEAYRALEAVRPLLPLVDPITEESTFTRVMQPVFEQAVETKLSVHDAAGEGPRIAQAQEIVETYRQAEIQSALGADCVPPREAMKPSELRAGEILLYPILLNDRIELIYAEGGAGGTQYRRLPANGAANRDTVSRLVAEMVASTSGDPNEAWRAPARRLYQLLIEPIEGRLKPDGVLVIVPDGPLRALPFAALQDGQGRFLVQRTRIDVAPALTYSQPGLDRSGRPLAVVAASLQKDVSLPAGFFPKLDGAADEAKVAAGPGDTKGRLIADFRKADLQAALQRGRVDVLHVATHAAFNGRSDRSFIVANDEAIPMADLRGMITANRARGDELDLLVLSACETAVGDDQATMGLAGAAVQSGARSALASLWQVNDLGTVELMKDFYAGYRAGLGKAEALRAAQLKMIAAGGDLATPNIWAAFTLLGGWR
jgi:CHAT domain-containing protein